MKNKNYFFQSIYWVLKALNDTFSVNDTKCYDRDYWLNKVFYPKWVLGECHHLCRHCEYKEECFGNLEE